MTFIPLDHKAKCVGYYQDGKLLFNQEPVRLDRTWKYSKYDTSVDFAQILASGTELDNCCPEHLKNGWQEANRKLSAFFKSFKIAKINFDDYCVYDLLPEHFLLQYCDLKTQIVDHLFNTHTKSKTYDFSVKLEEVLEDIRNRKLNIDTGCFKTRLYEENLRLLIKNCSIWDHRIDYNQFGSKTGRLTTKASTFPILNLKTEYREIIKPSNNFFLELDFNAAELRTLLALASLPQPLEDIHQVNAGFLKVSRDEAKQQAFAWLYGSTKVDGSYFHSTYKTEEILKKYHNQGVVTTCFDRQIEADDFHALNYIIQSTTSDMVLKQVIKVFNFLKQKKTTIGFIIHDSLVLDVSNEDTELMREIVDIFANNQFGIFPINISVGENFGKMKKISLKRI